MPIKDVRKKQNRENILHGEKEYATFTLVICLGFCKTTSTKKSIYVIGVSIAREHN